MLLAQHLKASDKQKNTLGSLFKTKLCNYSLLSPEGHGNNASPVNSQLGVTPALVERRAAGGDVQLVTLPPAYRTPQLDKRRRKRV